MAISACGGSSSGAEEIVDEATLSGIESGKLDLSLGIDTTGGEGGDVDVDLSGPFEAKEGAKAPELDMAAVVKGTVDGEKVDFEGGITLAGGNKAYVDFEGTDYEVDRTTYGYGTEILGESEEVSACQEAVSERQLSELIEDPTEEGTVEVGGTSTTKVSGDVDAEVMRDVYTEMEEDALCSEQLKAVPGFEASARELDEAKGEPEDSIKDAHLVLYVGDDHIVRRLQAQVAIEPPEGSAPGGAQSAEFDLDLTLADVNEPQAISAPKSTKPLTALFVKLGINPIELLGVLQSGIGGAGLTNFLERLADAGSAK
ncbi:MAG TPA: hypothetical protein VFW48_01975 [Solirubrobacterales bacterium]|nr:hypothetical protein [Solirubrobacterales bacterium]